MQSIRTTGALPFDVALVETAEPPAYQREVSAIRAVERWLAAHYQEVVAEQLAAREPHLVYDALWHPVGGWATGLEVPSGNNLVAHLQRGQKDSMIVAWGYYVNLRVARRDHPELQTLLDALRRDS